MSSSLLEEDLIKYDPLSEVTRKERRSLLGVSMLGLALITIPLVPHKIAALGVEFDEINQTTFVNIYSLLLAYYFTAFLIYAVADYIAWRRGDVIRYSAYKKEQGLLPAPLRPKGQLPDQRGTDRPTSTLWGKSENIAYRGATSFLAGMIASRARACFDLVFPLVFAGFVLARLSNFVP